MASSADIYSALSARAYAQQSWPAIGFHDQAAKALAKLLGVTSPLKNDPDWERHCLLRSQWFDQRCSEFFQRYPQAMCIDLGAGLSTRFHRLSKQDDWPRFSWVDIDLPEVTRLKSRAIPQIDNYRLMSADIVKDDWLAASGWHPHTPLIITLESVLNDLSQEDIHAIFANITKHCTSASNLEIVFDYPCKPRRWWRPFSRNTEDTPMKKLTSYVASLGLTLKAGELQQTGNEALSANSLTSQYVLEK